MTAVRRLTAAFQAHPGRTGLIPFITAGYPSLSASLEMLRGFSALGVRAVEVGIPFSDPIADGPEIQRSSEWALRSGIGGEQTLELIRTFRRESELPVVVMTYANPVVRHGAQEFARQAADAGVDGLIVSDLPPDESPEVWQALDQAALDTILLIAPTTDAHRLPLLIERCRGFVYCLSRTGVTGKAAGYAGSVPDRIAEVRTHTALPVAVGFGISTPDDAKKLDGVADAVVVGAAFMKTVTQDPENGSEERVVALASRMLEALRH